MFVGHYGVAFAARGAEKRLPLWVYFLAVQWVDLVWTVLVYFGVERVEHRARREPLGSLGVRLLPLHHSLAAGVAWAAIAFMGYRVITRMQGSQRVAAILALAVLSHWFLDLIVHQPDLPLYPGGLKVGLGLWNFPKTEFVVELVLLAAGVFYYFKKSPELSKQQRMGMIGGCCAMVAFQCLGDAGPPPHSVQFVAVSAFVLYLAFPLAVYFAESRGKSVFM